MAEKSAAAEDLWRRLIEQCDGLYTLRKNLRELWEKQATLSVYNIEDGKFVLPWDLQANTGKSYLYAVCAG